MLINDSPFNITRYTDIYGNLIVKKRVNKQFQIFGSKIETGEILVELDHVYIDGLYEIPIQQQITDVTNFKVNYTEGIVYFHSSKEGQLVNVNFTAKAKVDWKALNVVLIDQENHYPIKTVEAALQQNAQRIDNLVINTANPAEVLDSHIDSVNNITFNTQKARFDRDALDIKNIKDNIGDISQIGDDSLSDAIKSDRTLLGNENLKTISQTIKGGINETIGLIRGLHIDIRDYGAKCDGVTNDTTSVNNALTAAGNVNSLIKTVFIPEGTNYNTASITIPYGVQIKTQDRIIYDLNASTTSNTMRIQRKAVTGGGATGYVNSSLYVDHYVGSNITNNEWGLVTDMKVYANAGQHVGYYDKVYKNDGNSSVWGIALEVQDMTGMDSSGNSFVGIELLMATNQLNTNQNRIGLDIIATTAQQSLTAGELYCGIRIGGEKYQNGILTQVGCNINYGINMKHSGKGIVFQNSGTPIEISNSSAVGIDFTNHTGSNMLALKLKTGDAIALDSTGTIQIQYNSTNKCIEFWNGSNRMGYINMNGSDHVL